MHLVHVAKFREPSWHGREIKTSSGYIKDGETVGEAMLDCGMNAAVFLKKPVIFSHNGKTHTISNKNLLILARPNQEPVYLREITNYEPLQNTKLAEILNPLSKKMQLEGVAMVGQLAQISFVQFNLGDYDIGKDNHKSYLLIGDDKTSGGTYYLQTDTRTVCWNTWSQAIKGIPPIPHNKDSELILRYLTELEIKSHEARLNRIGLLNKMFTQKVQPKEVNSLVEKVFLMPKKSKKLTLFENGTEIKDDILMAKVNVRYQEEKERFETEQERVEKRRFGMAQEYVRFNDENGENGANTVYALFNAATGYINHSKDFTGDTTKALLSMFFGGTRAKLQARAWNECVELIK